MWGFSAIGELIQRICSASRGERRLIGIECAPHLQRDTHTTQASVSLTYRWVFEHPLVQNQSSNNKLYWLFWFVVTNALCSLVSGNACCKGFHSLDFTRVCDSVWLCVHNASQSTCTHRFAINNVYLRHVDWTKVTAEEGIRKQRNLLGGREKKLHLFIQAALPLLQLKCTLSFIREWAGGWGGLALYSVHHLFRWGKPVGAKWQSLLDHYLSAKTVGEEKSVESWSLKFLPSCWLHLPNQLSFPPQELEAKDSEEVELSWTQKRWSLNIIWKRCPGKQL